MAAWKISLYAMRSFAGTRNIPAITEAYPISRALAAPRTSYITDRSQRFYSSTSVVAPEYLSEGELKVFNMLKEKLSPEKLEVQDISGGCGSMYGIDVVSEQFKGLPVIKQHRLVNQVLGDEIKKWHGVQLKTKAP